MSRRSESRPIHWAEAFGLSVAVHVGVVFFAIDFINDIRFIPDRESNRPDLLVTSLVLDADTLTVATQSGAETTAGVAEAAETLAPDAVEPDTLSGTDPQAEDLAPAEPEDVATAEPDTLPETDPQPEDLAPAEPEDLATAEPDTLSGTDPQPEDLAAAEPEDLAAIEPDTLPGTEPDTPPADTAEPVTPEELTPEPAELAALETPASPAPEALEALPVEPDSLPAPAEPAQAEALVPLTPAPLAPQALSPLRPDNDTVAALAPLSGTGPDRLTASIPSNPATVAPDRPAAVQTLSGSSVQTLSGSNVQTLTSSSVRPLTGDGVQRVAPRVTRPPLATPPPPVATTAPPPPPGSPAAVVAELVSKIRNRVAESCLIAVPQQTADGAPELVMLSDSEPAIRDFASSVLEGIDPPPGQRAVLIDPRQCEALTYIRENPSYPAFRLTVGLASDQLSGQALLQGAIGRAGGNYVSLLLVDDNGVVQDLNTYLSFAAGEVRFEVPLRRAGNARDTSAMLIAVASDSRPATLDTQNGQEADVFFAALRAELGSNIPIVMIPFDLR